MSSQPTPALPLLQETPAARIEPTLIDLIEKHLAGSYYCGRVWSAWQMGTMTEDDFTAISQTDIPGELAAEIVAALPPQYQQERPAQSFPHPDTAGLIWRKQEICESAHSDAQFIEWPVDVTTGFDTQAACLAYSAQLRAAATPVATAEPATSIERAKEIAKVLDDARDVLTYDGNGGADYRLVDKYDQAVEEINEALSATPVATVGSEPAGWVSVEGGQPKSELSEQGGSFTLTHPLLGLLTPDHQEPIYGYFNPLDNEFVDLNMDYLPGITHYCYVASLPKAPAHEAR